MGLATNGFCGRADDLIWSAWESDALVLQGQGSLEDFIASVVDNGGKMIDQLSILLFVHYSSGQGR